MAGRKCSIVTLVTLFSKLSLNCLLAIAASWQNQCWLKFLEIPVLVLFDRSSARFVFPCFYLAIVDGIPIEQIGNLKNEEDLNHHRFGQIPSCHFLFLLLFKGHFVAAARG